MRRSSDGHYAVDRLYMAHLGSRLRAEYDRRFRDPLPPRFWDMLLKLALIEALSERRQGHAGAQTAPDIVTRHERHRSASAVKGQVPLAPMANEALSGSMRRRSAAERRRGALDRP